MIPASNENPLTAEGFLLKPANQVFWASQTDILPIVGVYTGDAVYAVLKFVFEAYAKLTTLKSSMSIFATYPCIYLVDD